jgi:hypothetical protein
MDAREGLKEELGWLKVLLVLVATLDASVLSWLSNPASRNRFLQSVAAGLVLIGIGWGLQMFRRGWIIIADLKRSAP